MASVLTACAGGGEGALEACTLYPTPSTWGVCPAQILVHVARVLPHAVVPPYAWAAAVRSTPEVPFHPLLSMIGGFLSGVYL